MRWLLALVLLIGTVLPCASSTYAASGGIQVTPDHLRIVANKDVGTERWAITLNLDDGSVVGNVFRTDGPLAFIWCALTGTTGTDENEIDHFACFGSDACAAPPCGTEQQWQSIGSDIQLPVSFWLP